MKCAPMKCYMQSSTFAIERSGFWSVGVRYIKAVCDRLSRSYYIYINIYLY